MNLLIMLLLVSLSFGEVLRLKDFLRDTLEGNRELNALREDLLALQQEAEAAGRDLLPSVVFEERFLRTDIPAQVLFVKLNQERISASDLSPSVLNNPDPVSNFETSLRLEVPIWMGGGLRARRDIKALEVEVEKLRYRFAEERILLEAYETFINASFLREAVSVAMKNLDDAKEHLKIAEALYRTGVALLSDVLRAKVRVAKAEEGLKDAERRYRDSLEAMALLSGRDYSRLTPEPLGECPPLPEDLIVRAIENRPDLKALRKTLRLIDTRRSLKMSEIMPSLTAFASYTLYDRDTPFGSEGNGYSFGLSLTLRLNMGLSTIKKMKSEDHRRRALLQRIDHLKERIGYEVRKAVREYEASLAILSSAKRRLEEAEETVRIIKLRYKNGLARMVDLIDAQTQLEMARLDHLEALRRCHISYAKALFSAGLIREVLR